MRARDAVQRAAQRAVTQGAASWLLASVTATYTDGTVDVLTARGPVLGVRRGRHYTSPAVSDVVIVLTNPDGNWVVLDALATS